jgi:hypothetical protein
MSILVKVLMLVVGGYLIVWYILRFALALRKGRLDDDDELVSYLWPLELLAILIDWIIDRTMKFRPMIARAIKRPANYISICFYWMSLPFRPAEFGKVLHRLLRKGDSQ